MRRRAKLFLARFSVIRKQNKLPTYRLRTKIVNSGNRSQGFKHIDAVSRVCRLAELRIGSLMTPQAEKLQLANSVWGAHVAASTLSRTEAMYCSFLLPQTVFRLFWRCATFLGKAVVSGLLHDASELTRDGPPGKSQLAGRFSDVSFRSQP